MNHFGRNFSISLFGESHGQGIGVVIDGVPPGIALDESTFEPDLARRRSGAKGTTPRKESDVPEILSGVFNGHTTGAPIAILFRNENTISGDYRNLLEHPRPSHADFTARARFGGWNDPRGGGHFSGRITLCLVAAGVVAKTILAQHGITPRATVISIGGESDPARFEALIAETVMAQDSIGGVIECRTTGIPAGWGDPFFYSVESVIAHLAFSVPAVKGIEFGKGFAVAASKGSQNNDRIIDAQGTTATNNDGGIVGGITNGNEIVFRVAVKPTSSISLPQQTFHFGHGQVEELVVRGRHDACIALRVPVIIESVTAIALADFMVADKRK